MLRSFFEELLPQNIASGRKECENGKLEYQTKDKSKEIEAKDDQ